jgi:hypothetical protein
MINPIFKFKAFTKESDNLFKYNNTVSCMRRKTALKAEEKIKAQLIDESVKHDDLYRKKDIKPNKNSKETIHFEKIDTQEQFIQSFQSIKKTNKNFKNLGQSKIDEIKTKFVELFGNERCSYIKKPSNSLKHCTFEEYIEYATKLNDKEFLFDSISKLLISIQAKINTKNCLGISKQSNNDIIDKNNQTNQIDNNIQYRITLDSITRDIKISEGVMQY